MKSILKHNHHRHPTATTFRRGVVLLFLLFWCNLQIVVAHVPYIEDTDYTAENPFVWGNSIEVSFALYNYLESPTDYDVVQFQVDQSVRLRTRTIVPQCSPDYDDFHPWLAIVGPGQPVPSNATVPLLDSLPAGYGATVVQTSVEDREVDKEPFGGKNYFEGTTFDEEISEPGTWYLVVWHPDGMMGDYVLSTGFDEVKSGLETFFTTLRIRFDDELHVAKCSGSKK